MSDGSDGEEGVFLMKETYGTKKEPFFFPLGNPFSSHENLPPGSLASPINHASKRGSRVLTTPSSHVPTGLEL